MLKACDGMRRHEPVTAHCTDSEDLGTFKCSNLTSVAYIYQQCRWLTVDSLNGA